MRPSGRNLNDMRPVSIEIGVMKHAEGSCLIKMGETHVLCSATIEDKAPPFLKNTGLGWVTAEYGMLPRATNSRTRREAAAGLVASKGTIVIDIPLTREAMADYLGLTLETVSRQMSTLKRAGVIELDGKRRVIVPMFEALVAESGDDSDGGPLS